MEQRFNNNKHHEHSKIEIVIDIDDDNNEATPYFQNTLWVAGEMLDERKSEHEPYVRNSFSKPNDFGGICVDLQSKRVQP